MLSRANLLGRVQSADPKCIANRRLDLLEIDDTSRPNRHGSETSIKLRKHCSDLKTDEQVFMANRPLHLSKPHCSKDFDSRMSNSTQQTGISHTKDEMQVTDPLVRYTTGYGVTGNGNPLWSSKIITLDCLRSVECQQTKDLNPIKEVEMRFSTSRSSLSPNIDDGPTSRETSLRGRAADLPATYQRGLRRTEGARTETALAKVWKRKKEARRIGGLLLLNGLAAVYGSSNVANKYVAEAAPALPASLTMLVKFTSGLIFFIPALISALKRREGNLLRAGAELGGLGFAAAVVDSCNPRGSSSSSPSLLYAFTVIFVPLMELVAGRQSGLKLSRLATLAAAILGMGLLEEEGLGWKGISCPQVSDLWSVAVSAILALHIFRSEALGEKFDTLQLNAVQCGVLASLSLGWELWSTFDASTLQSHVLDIGSLQSVPWVPLVYNGLVCSGLCSWLELRGLQSVHASTATLVYTTIPVWGAFLSSFTSHDIYTDSAIVGGLVLVATSIHAQVLSKDEDLRVVQAAKATVSSNLDQSSTTSNKTTDEKTATSQEKDYFPAGLLVSQLKFPYYAAQAKGLLAEIKIKVGVLKSFGLVLSGISSSSILPTSPSSTLSISSAATTMASMGENNLTISNLGSASPQAIDISTAATVPVGNDFVITAAMAVPPDLSDVLAHPSTVTTSGLESVLMAVSSDLKMAVQEAEDVATILERFVQVGGENTVHVVATCLAAGDSLGVLKTELTGSDAMLQLATNFVETARELPEAVYSDLLRNYVHLTDALVKEFTHVSDIILPLFNNI